MANLVRNVQIGDHEAAAAEFAEVFKELPDWLRPVEGVANTSAVNWFLQAKQVAWRAVTMNAVEEDQWDEQWQDIQNELDELQWSLEEAARTEEEESRLRLGYV